MFVFVISFVSYIFCVVRYCPIIKLLMA